MIDTSGFTCFRFDIVDDHILVVTLDHPTSAVNAVDSVLHDEFRRLFGRLRDERDLRAIILRAEGDAFSAGGDFSWFPTLRSTEALTELRAHARRMIWDLLDVDVPIIASVGGAAMGLGASIALLCDVIVCAEDAVLGDPHVRAGLVAGDGGAVIWPMAVGPAIAKEHLLTGRPLGAAEAERRGLVNRVVGRADVDDTALGIAREIAANPPLAVRYTKAAVNKGIRARMEVVFDFATALELETFRSDDHAEAVSTFVERRSPTFRGR